MTWIMAVLVVGMYIIYPITSETLKIRRIKNEITKTHSDTRD